MKKIDYNDTIELCLNAQKLVFFCGSGISQFSPTNLPNGSEIINTLYKSLEKDYYNFTLKNIDLQDLTNLPLETLTGLIINDIKDPLYANIIYQIAQFFQNAIPNRLHYLIAYFLYKKQNCFVITTNYDICCEKAFQYIADKDSNSAAINNLQIFHVDNLKHFTFNNTNSILKIHGCAKLDTPDNIVFTTKQESQSFPQQFLKNLQLLLKDSLVVFLGYSFSEPDCLEALLDVSDFEVIWADKDFNTFVTNNRVQKLLESVNSPLFLENIIPFIEKTWTNINPNLDNNYLQEFDNPYYQIPFARNRIHQVNNGILLYEQLVKTSSLEHLYRIIISGYLQLRNFTKVEVLLDEYKQINQFSQYFFLYSLASIIRDKNNNWEKACSLFKQASQLNNITEIEKASAQLEQYGLESLLYQGNNTKLVNVENKLNTIISFAQGKLTTLLKNCWLNILGRSQKNVIQNICYQTPLTINRLQYALNISNDAINNLLESQEIHARIECERFKARLHQRIYTITHNNSELIEALQITEKTLRLFGLLASSMGEINAKRQYIFLLIKLQRLSDAYREITDLKRILTNSQDKLSQIKTTTLEVYYYYTTRNKIKFIKTVILLVKSSFHFTESHNYLANFFLAVKWYLSWFKGTSG